MMFKVALTTLAVAATAAASCAYSNEGHGFEMYIYGQTSCGTGNHWEEFYGGGSPCQCFEIASTLDNKVKSFVFTASKNHEIVIYKDANCKGEILGHSVGNWIDVEVSTAGQQMSSFTVCPY